MPLPAPAGAPGPAPTRRLLHVWDSAHLHSCIRAFSGGATKLLIATCYFPVCSVSWPLNLGPWLRWAAFTRHDRPCTSASAFLAAAPPGEVSGLSVVSSSGQNRQPASLSDPETKNFLYLFPSSPLSLFRFWRKFILFGSDKTKPAA